MESLPDPVNYQDGSNEQFQHGVNDLYQPGGNEQFQQGGNEQFQQGGNEQFLQGTNEQYQDPHQQDNMQPLPTDGEQLNQNYQDTNQSTNQDINPSINQDMNQEVSQNPDNNLPENWRDGDWKCSSCGEHNFASRTFCRQCDKVKDGVTKDEPTGKEKRPDGWREGDWKCSECGDHQFASRMYCRQCDAPKPRPSDPCKLYCGNLKPETSEELLKDEMSKFGEVNDCYILGPKGNSKGFGFVVYKNQESVKAALSAEVVLDGNKLKIEKSMSRREDGFSSRRVNKQRLYIGGVKRGTTEDQMKEYLQQFGDVTDIAIMGERGFGFVTFADSSGTQAALSAKLEFNGSTLDIQRARPKREEPRMPPWAGYGGGWGGYDYRGGYENYYRGHDYYRGGYENYHRGGYDRYDRYERSPPWARHGRYDRGYDRGYSRRDMSPRRGYRR